MNAFESSGLKAIMHRGLILLMSVWLAGSVCAQPEKESAPQRVTEKRATETTALETLRLVQAELDKNSSERAALRDAIASSRDDDVKAELSQKLTVLKEEYTGLKRKFDTITTRIDLDAYEGLDVETVSLQEEMTRLLLPVISELKQATSSSRDMEMQRRTIAVEEQKLSMAEQAAERSRELSLMSTNPALQQRLQELSAEWTEKAQAKETELSALQLELEQMQSNRKSLFATGSQAFTSFMNTRGRNLILGVLALVIVFLLFRGAGRILLAGMQKKSDRSTFSLRIAILVFQILSILAALTAMLVVFNVTGDWFLLGITLLVLMAAAWGMIKTLPSIFEQLKLILNLGAVREGEVLVFDGIPWKVKSLGLVAEMENPKLDGGLIDLPIQELVGHHSRTQGNKEPLFPTNKGDWVLINGETHAKILSQTPSIVEILELGGARTAIPTGDFLSLHPVNLSFNFRVAVTFGIDYQHQAQCTKEIPALMTEVIKEGLTDEVPAEDIVSLKVKFTQAGASSLDYDIIADIKGSSAGSYKDIKRALSRLAVDACNQYGWVIPFTQITMHQASAPSAPEPAES